MLYKVLSLNLTHRHSCASLQCTRLYTHRHARASYIENKWKIVDVRCRLLLRLINRIVFCYFYQSTFVGSFVVQSISFLFFFPVVGHCFCSLRLIRCFFFYLSSFHRTFMFIVYFFMLFDEIPGKLGSKNTGQQCACSFSCSIRRWYSCKSIL